MASGELIGVWVCVCLCKVEQKYRYVMLFPSSSIPIVWFNAQVYASLTSVCVCVCVREDPYWPQGCVYLVRVEFVSVSAFPHNSSVCVTSVCVFVCMTQKLKGTFKSALTANVLPTVPAGRGRAGSTVQSGWKQLRPRRALLSGCHAAKTVTFFFLLYLNI